MQSDEAAARAFFPPDASTPPNASYPVRGGNAVAPLIDGHPAFDRICRAIEAAQASVWVTVAFLDPDFRMPGGRGSLFDVLDAAAARGLDVRALFWRNNRDSGFAEDSMFSGSAEHRAMLSARRSGFAARWDRAEGRYCQHQKSWLVAAGHPAEVAFVGGINLASPAMVRPGHAEEQDRHSHDVYVELAGPSATDVHHNFVQRWNEASDRAQADGAWPHPDRAGDLPFPTVASGPRGDVAVQVQRTVRAGRYADGTAAPGGRAFPVAGGERSCFEQYQRAIAAATGYVYLENQALGQPETVEALHAALGRGVVVTVLVPADPERSMARARADPRSAPFFDRLGALGEHPDFLLAGIARRTARATNRNIYVHAKAAVIDDVWATIGSCNIGARSFFGDTELNVSFVSAREARVLRAALFAEHLGFATEGEDGVSASRRYQQVARRNAARFAAGEPLHGLAHALDPRTYGTAPA